MRPPSTAARRSPATASTAARARRRELPREHGHRHELRRLHGPERHDLLLQGVCRERARRGATRTRRRRPERPRGARPAAPTLDDFNRPDELPVSGAGRVPSASTAPPRAASRSCPTSSRATRPRPAPAGARTRSTGPTPRVDEDVVPGAGNHIRLNARLQQVGGTGYDGYMLRTNQLSELTRSPSSASTAGSSKTADAQPRAHRRRYPPSARQRSSRPGTTTVPPGRGSARRATRRTPPGLCRHRPRPDRPPRRLRGCGGSSTPPGAPTASPRSPATRARPSPGRHRSSTAARRSPAIASIAARARVTRASRQSVARPRPSWTAASRTADVLLQGVRRECGRRGAALERDTATPTGLVAPALSLVPLDDFNRPNENPLSDGLLWTNAVNGGVENGLHVSSNQLACTATTTCTAWRSSTPYGPDVEVDARHGAARDEQPHPAVRAASDARRAAYDAYLLRTNEPRRHRRDLPRADRQRCAHTARDDQPRARGR